jgi:hypothetical protein
MPSRSQKAWLIYLSTSLIFVYFVPFLSWSYFGPHVILASVAEPLTEFIIIPIFTGSLAAIMLENSFAVSWFYSATKGK